MPRCWKCAKFKIAKLGKKDIALDCGFSSAAKYDPECGYYHDRCPEYDCDVPERVNDCVLQEITKPKQGVQTNR